MSEPPVLRIVAGGAPSDEETAALAAVLTVVAQAGQGVDDPEPVARWRDSCRPATAGARGWLAQARRSALRRPL